MPDVPRQRAWRALTGRPGPGQTLVAVLLGLLGFAAAVQVRSVDTGDPYAGARRGDLVQLLETVSAAQSRALAQLDELESTRDALELSTQQSEAALAEEQRRLDVLRLLSGQVAATGPGIAITIGDPDGVVGATTLLNAVEELRDAGAEAIEVNNQARVVAQTWFGDGPDQADSPLVVDGQPVSAPYVVEAIGAPDTLAKAVTFPGGLADEVETLGGTVAVASADSVQVDSVVAADDTEFAVPGRLTPSGEERSALIPDELGYTAEHEWVRREDDGDVTIGITDFAQDALGDIVYVSLPEVGERLDSGTSVGELESTKSVSDVYAPVAGAVVARNDALDQAPDLVNSDPYGQGWLLRVRLDDEAALDGLLDADGYRAQIGS